MTEVTLAECPPGLFQTPEGHWGFKTEYAHKSESDGRYYPEAYVVESGEFFWGGASDHPERAKLLVRPIDAAAFVAAFDAMQEAALAARNRIWGLEATAIADGKTELAQKLEGWANDLSAALTAARIARGGA